MRRASRRQRKSLFDSYVPQLGLLIERRSTESGLLAAKREAERAATRAQQAMFDAKAADRAKTTFLANMSHELRTPLNAIMGFSEIIQIDDGRRREQHGEYAGYIHESAEHLLGIVNDILDIARIEAGKLEIEDRTDAVYTIIRSAVQTIRPLAEQKSIEILDNCASLDVLASVDQLKFRQILINLLSNAVKFTGPGGRVEIAAELRGDGDLAISVSDTGIGISAENLGKIFEPFEQVEDHLARKGMGSGLGLPIARALARLHGGELTLSSRLAVGTTAELRLPHSRVRRLAAFESV